MATYSTCLASCGVTHNFSSSKTHSSPMTSCRVVSQLLSWETASPGRQSADRPEDFSAIFFSKFKLHLQLSVATFSRAFPTSLSLLLNRLWFIVGTFVVESKLFRWVFLMLTRGPRLPALCSAEDFISFRWPQKLHLMLEILLRPLCFSSTMFTRDNGPVGAINGVVMQVIYLCIEANSWRKANTFF